MCGIAFLAVELSNQGFLWGALYSGIWGILAPFVLIFLGAALVYLGIFAKEKHRKPKKLHSLSKTVIDCSCNRL
jgi:hypothetical protein